jgi:hypothetical protein
MRSTGSRRGLRLALALFLLVDLAVLGTDVFLLRSRSTTTVVDLQDALTAFRSQSASSSGISAPAGGAEVPGAATGEPIGASVVAPTSTGASTTSSTPVPSSAPATPKAGALVPPPSGVYHYRTTGGESVSLLGSRHDYPADTYAVVRPTGGCGWLLEAEVVKEHVDRRRMCTSADRVAQHSQQRAVTFFGTTDGADLPCEPPMVWAEPGIHVGWTTQTDCSAAGVVGKMVVEVTAIGPHDVGGATIDTVTIRVDGTMTGRVRGTSYDLVTFDARTGLPVAMERTVDTMADAFGTSVRYQEAATFQLVSLTPQT